MTEDRSNALIVHIVVDLGHNLGLTIVAEGVETAQALTALAGVGCDVAQGYHLGRPMPVDAFDTWYATRPPVAMCAPAVAAFATRVPLSLIHISEPTRLLSISYAVFCLK